MLKIRIFWPSFFSLWSSITQCFRIRQNIKPVCFLDGLHDLIITIFQLGLNNAENIIMVYFSHRDKKNIASKATCKEVTIVTRAVKSKTDA